MTFTTIATIISSTYKTNVIDSGPTVPSGFDNSPFERPNSLHGLAFIIPGPSMQESLGSTKRYRNHGQLVVQLFDKLQAGDGVLLAKADAIATIFRTSTYSSGGQYVHFRTPTIQRVGRVAVQGKEGAWWQINVNCPYYADIIQ